MIEVRTPDGREVRHTISVDGVHLRLLDQGPFGVLTYGSDGVFRLWDADSGGVIYTSESGAYQNSWAALSPERGLLAVAQASVDGESFLVRILDVVNGEEVARFDTPWKVRGGTWSPSEDHLFAWSDDGAGLWSLPDGSLIAHLEQEGRCTGGLFSTDGSHLVTVAVAGELRVWDAGTGAFLRKLEGHDDRAIIEASFNGGVPDLFVTTSYDQTSRVWDVEAGETLRVFRGVHSRPMAGGGIDDGAHYCSLTEKGVFHTWSMNISNWPKILTASEGEIEGAWFIEGGEQVLVSTSAPGLEVIDWRSGVSTLDHSWSDPDAVVEGFDDSRAVVQALGGVSSRVLEWSWKTGTERELTGAGDAVNEIVPFGDGDPRHLLLCASGQAEVWDFEQDTLLYKVAPAELVKISRSGRFIATGERDGFVRLWSAHDGELLRELGPFEPNNGNYTITALDFSIDEEHLYAGCGDAHIRCWEVDTGELLADVQPHTANQIEMIGDGFMIISAQYSGKLVLFELAKTHSGQLPDRVQLNMGTMTGSPLQVSRDGRHMLYSDKRLPVRLLNISRLLPEGLDKERAVQGSFTLDPNSDDPLEHLGAAVFSPDDRWILAVGGGSAWLWPKDLAPAAQEASPVGIDFFGGFPSLGLEMDEVK